MRKKRIMIMGAGRCGKTTLAVFLEGSGSIRRIPNMVYRPVTIDAPGAYLESPWMHSHLIATAQDACCIVMMADTTKRRFVYPPEFAKAFRIPIFGVMTKGDLDEADRTIAMQDLLQAGVKPPYYEINGLEPESMKNLKEILFSYLSKEDLKKLDHGQ